MFTYFILMLVSTLSGAFISLLVSSHIFVKRSEEMSKEPPIHRGLVRIQIIEQAIKDIENEIVLLNDLIEHTEKFILSQTEKERDEVKASLSEEQEQVLLSVEDLREEVKELQKNLEALGASSDINDFVDEVIQEIRDRL